MQVRSADLHRIEGRLGRPFRAGPLGQGAEGTRQYYLDSARSAFLETCCKSAASTMDMSVLTLLGYDTTAQAAAKARGKRASMDEPGIVADSELARRHMQLVLHSCKRRVASMSWHSHSWPGLLALFLAGDSATLELGCGKLREDFLAWQACKEKGAANEFLKGCADGDARAKTMTTLPA